MSYTSPRYMRRANQIEDPSGMKNRTEPQVSRRAAVWTGKDREMFQKGSFATYETQLCMYVHTIQNYGCAVHHDSDIRRPLLDNFADDPLHTYWRRCSFHWSESCHDLLHPCVISCNGWCCKIPQSSKTRLTPSSHTKRCCCGFFFLSLALLLTFRHTSFCKDKLTGHATHISMSSEKSLRRNVVYQCLLLPSGEH